MDFRKFGHATRERILMYQKYTEYAVEFDSGATVMAFASDRLHDSGKTAKMHGIFRDRATGRGVDAVAFPMLNWMAKNGARITVQEGKGAEAGTAKPDQGEFRFERYVSLDETSLAFRNFVKKVRVDFAENRDKYFKKVESLMPKGAKLVRIELGGSYGKGDPTEESDVDLMVYFRGNVSSEDVADALYGQVIGYGGVFDVIPKNVDLEAESFGEAEVVSGSVMLWNEILNYRDYPYKDYDGIVYVPAVVIDGKTWYAEKKNGWNGYDVEYQAYSSKNCGAVNYYDRGFLVGTQSFDKDGLVLLGVRPDMRGKGMGTELVRRAILAGSPKKVSSDVVSRQALGILQKLGVTV